MPRIAREHLLERGDGDVGASLLLEDDADVEVGRDQLRIERKRALVSAQCVFAQMHHLQCDAVVVVRIRIGGQGLQNFLECGARRDTIVPRELDQAQCA